MKFETRRERELRLKRQRRSGIIGILLAFTLVIVLGVVMWKSKNTLESKNAQYEAQITELQSQIADEQDRTESLEEYKKYIQTKKFVEQVAKEKFGLIYPDELVFKSSN